MFPRERFVDSFGEPASIRFVKLFSWIEYLLSKSPCHSSSDGMPAWVGSCVGWSLAPPCWPIHCLGYCSELVPTGSRSPFLF